MMIAAFGEYIVRCLFSKHWNLREAALMKIRENVLYGANASHIAFDMYFKIVSIGLKDSKAQVFQACCKLFGSLLKNKWNISNDELRQQVYLFGSSIVNINVLGEANHSINLLEIWGQPATTARFSIHSFGDGKFGIVFVFHTMVIR